jgi:ADP-ribose pyrophosphatase
MPLKTWKKIRQVLEIKNPWWTYRQDDVSLSSGKTGEYHFVHVKGSSMIVPILSDGKIILVKQYRYLADRESLELPCGSVKETSTYDETARHELAEETGYRANDWRYVAEFNPYNGVTDEMCKVFIARNLIPVKVQHDETEEFEHFFLFPQEIDAKIESGEIWDGMTLAAWALVKHYFV